MKRFSKKQLELMRFSIYIAGAAIIYGINLAFKAGYANRWVALVLTITVMFFTFWSAGNKFWQTRINENEPRTVK